LPGIAEKTDLTYEGIETRDRAPPVLGGRGEEKTDLTYEGIETMTEHRRFAHGAVREKTDLTYEGIETPGLVLADHRDRAPRKNRPDLRRD